MTNQASGGQEPPIIYRNMPAGENGAGYTRQGTMLEKTPGERRGERQKVGNAILSLFVEASRVRAISACL